MALSVLQGDPAVSGHLQDLNLGDWAALFYTSLFGSAISYGVFFYNATRGELSIPGKPMYNPHNLSLVMFSGVAPSGKVETCYYRL